MFGMMAVFAEFERAMIQERVRAGLKRAVAAGKTLGRFLLNTTVGLGGIWDVAIEAGWERHNSDFGQTLALQAGLDRARGDAIVTMDGDLQNDPADIPRLITEPGRSPGAPGLA